ncbi:hypothetical protein NKT34_03635 [Paenibacillus polysaccharolyticus]|uniref:YfzA-like protein n=1 Tax=Paenibacillus polysaccharolyticus TaxID=582692 RepID=A0A1G5BHI3_9BACL|nr:MULTISPECIES: hypothetical protein [Paenibacillus]MCP1132367.1 hypothetical protein [Paenibacillus polysaccharolyticus]SCX89549.1 hypothetical protein SAMN05720606_101376 [Paenibacillus polysaccharolyticus]
MKIHKKIFNLSAWLAVLAVFFIPGTLNNDNEPLRTEYGFPLRFLTDYHVSNSNGSIWFISNMHINLLVYFVNVLFIYAGIHVIVYIKKRLTNKSVE